MACIWPPTSCPHHMPHLQAMEQAYGDIEVRSIHGWIRHTRRGSIRTTHAQLPCFSVYMYSTVVHFWLIVVIFELKLNLLNCKVQYCNVQYWVFDFLVVVKTCLLWNWIKTVNMEDCSVLYKVDQCVNADLKVYSYDASVFHFDIRVPGFDSRV